MEQPDARPPCWPVEETTPGGTVEVGTGVTAFMPMPPEVNFEIGTQSGLQIVVWSRLKDMHPGDAGNAFSKDNPRTRFSAIMHDGREVKPNCSLPLGYAARPDGWYDLTTWYIIEFLPFELGEYYYNTNARLVVEVIDRDKRYARDERMVFVKPPP